MGWGITSAGGGEGRGASGRWGEEEAAAGVLFGEEGELPLGAEGDGGAFEGVGKESRAGGEGVGVGDVGGGVEPADESPGGGFEAGFGAVFGLEAVLEDFELEGADGAEQRDAPGVGGQAEGLDGAFLEELVEAFAEALVLRRRGVVDPGEALGREGRHGRERKGRVGRKGVADAEFGMADDADDVAGVGGVDGFAVAGEELAGMGEADFLAAADVEGLHVALEDAGADAEEGDLVAMVGVHVGLDLEDEGGECGRGGRQELAGGGLVRSGRRRVAQEGVEEELDAEVVSCAR